MSYGERRFGGGNRFGGGGFGPKPVETGKEYDVQITETSRKGDGIARVQGFVIFVKGGRVGQKTKIRVTNVGARFATGEVVAGASQEHTQAAGPGGFAPSVAEEDKPNLQDYQSETAEETK